MNARLTWHRVAAALAGALLAGACLVPDVELVSEFSGDAGKGSGGNAGGGKAGAPSAGASSDGGEDAAAGADSGGTSSGSGGSGQAGTPNPGGSSGMNQGGSAGMNQGGNNNPIEIPDLQVCPDPNYEVCDNFDTGQLDGIWPQGTQGMPALTGAAPSGDSVLITPYQPVQLQLPYDAINVSFWVRISDLPDQHIFSFISGAQFQLGLGIEAARLRWMMAPVSSTNFVVAPSSADLTVALKSATWYCMEVKLGFSGGTEVLNARLVEPGEPPFDLPVLDHDPTPDNDQELNQSHPGWFTSSDFLIFGDMGSRLEFDDVMIGLLDTPTLCDRYLEQL